MPNLNRELSGTYATCKVAVAMAEVAAATLYEPGTWGSDVTIDGTVVRGTKPAP